jgi:hypothetical protein
MYVFPSAEESSIVLVQKLVGTLNGTPITARPSLNGNTLFLSCTLLLMFALVTMYKLAGRKVQSNQNENAIKSFIWTL